jgi:hypothetical protein
VATRTRRGRAQLDRAGIRAFTGASAATINRWHHHRVETGFPAAAESDRDGRQWWWRTDIRDFHARHLATRAGSFTRLDRTGNPDELLTAPQAAKILGYIDHRSLPRLLLDHPDQVEPLPSGRLRRRWYRATVWAYADGRRLRHSTGRPVRPALSGPPGSGYQDDPRLSAARRLLDDVTAPSGAGLGVLLAAQLGVNVRTAQRLLASARPTNTASPPARRPVPRERRS